MQSMAIQSYQDQVQTEKALQWVMRLHGLPAGKLPSVEEVQAVVTGLSEPSDPAWLSQRIKGLLSQYYEKNLDVSAQAFISMDWIDALADYPQWAIDRAVRWWKSADNPRRHKAPLEGDIAERAKMEFGSVTAAPRLIQSKLNQKAEREAVVLTDQQRTNRLAEIADLQRVLRAKIDGGKSEAQPKGPLTIDDLMARAAEYRHEADLLDAEIAARRIPKDGDDA